MVAISLMLEGQYGMTWSRWKNLVAEVEDLGFAGMFRSDHFTNAKPPDMDSLEMIVSQTEALASWLIGRSLTNPPKHDRNISPKCLSAGQSGLS